MSSPAEQPPGLSEGQAAEQSAAAPSPMSVPSRVDATERIAQQIASLDALRELPLADHADAYQQVHTELQRALAEIDSA